MLFSTPQRVEEPPDALRLIRPQVPEHQGHRGDGLVPDDALTTRPRGLARLAGFVDAARERVRRTRTTETEVERRGEGPHAVRDLLRVFLPDDTADQSALSGEHMLGPELVEPQREQMLGIDAARARDEGESHENSLVHTPAAEEPGGLLPTLEHGLQHHRPPETLEVTAVARAHQQVQQGRRLRAEFPSAP